MQPRIHEVSLPDTMQALARASRGGSTAAALAANIAIQENHQEVLNVAPLAAGNPISLTLSLTTTTGKVRVRGSAAIIAGSALAGDTITFSLEDDGTQTGPAAADVLSSGLTAQASLDWIFTVTPGTHTFGIVATNAASRTIQAVAQNFSLVVQELAG
jgi:hypothetical protein